MRFRLEHALPRRLRYAKVYLEAGTASISFSLDGANADWHAIIGRKPKSSLLSDREYSRLRASAPATEALGDDGRMFVVRSASGREETWLRPRWTLLRASGPERPGEHPDK
ncbi:MAG TPA: hypothetical protein VKF15_05260 [Nitrososphaerales archaeon]|nr:hypothetical protein [Nitrososphaerales archaeon]